MSGRAKILAELDRQAAHEGETQNVKMCRAIAQHAQFTSEWQALISVQYHRYGKLSYEVYPFYYVRPWVESMIANLQSI
jgi:hypothetical protein